jgi:hypothetical protein
LTTAKNGLPLFFHVGKSCRKPQGRMRFKGKHDPARRMAKRPTCRNSFRCAGCRERDRQGWAERLFLAVEPLHRKGWALHTWSGSAKGLTYRLNLIRAADGHYFWVKRDDGTAFILATKPFRGSTQMTADDAFCEAILAMRVSQIGGRWCGPSKGFLPPTPPSQWKYEGKLRSFMEVESVIVRLGDYQTLQRDPGFTHKDLGQNHARGFDRAVGWTFTCDPTYIDAENRFICGDDIRLIPDPANQLGFIVDDPVPPLPPGAVSLPGPASAGSLPPATAPAPAAASQPASPQPLPVAAQVITPPPAHANGGPASSGAPTSPPMETAGPLPPQGVEADPDERERQTP